MIRKKCNIIVFSTQYYFITALPKESVYTEFYLGFFRVENKSTKTNIAF